MLSDHTVSALAIIIAALSGIIAVIKAIINGQREDGNKGQ